MHTIDPDPRIREGDPRFERIPLRNPGQERVLHAKVDGTQGNVAAQTREIRLRFLTESRNYRRPGERQERSLNQGLTHPASIH